MALFKRTGALQDAVPTVNFATKFEFGSERGQFYLDLCENMRAMPGVPITKFLSNYAKRYPNRAVGKMALYWLHRFTETGTLTASLRGTVPDEDLTVLAVFERAGDLVIGLESLGKNILAMAQTKKEIITTLMSGIILVVLLHVFLAVQAFMVMPPLRKALEAGGTDASFGRLAKVMFGGADLVRTWWPLELILLALVVGWVTWSLPRYTGRFRPWLDNHLLPYQIYRDFRGARFLITLGSVTRQIGAQIVQVGDALHLIRENSVTWLRWHIDMVLHNMEEQPNVKGELFNTGIVNETNYYRVVDVAEYAQLSTMLTTIGELIMKTSPVEIAKKASRSRFVLMIVSLLLMVGIYAATLVLINDFKNEMQVKTMVR
ncbi:hypothetical protein [Ralstonia thomasii]|uniref:General secretion pathway protein n=1 Tax=Ralstonia thomasii TaxID=3058596 RepID=A0ABM9JWT0_9RALS|nr:hypothetical protein [Ralstonia sp. LMG 18095]CAJ0807009.1 hypothetical protein LMG18095_04536 [Ralstonia sp. LMG 18095]